MSAAHDSVVLPLTEDNLNQLEFYAPLHTPSPIPTTEMMDAYVRGMETSISETSSQYGETSSQYGETSPQYGDARVTSPLASGSYVMSNTTHTNPVADVAPVSSPTTHYAPSMPTATPYAQPTKAHAAFTLYQSNVAPVTQTGAKKRGVHKGKQKKNVAAHCTDDTQSAQYAQSPQPAHPHPIPSVFDANIVYVECYDGIRRISRETFAKLKCGKRLIKHEGQEILSLPDVHLEDFDGLHCMLIGKTVTATREMVKLVAEFDANITHPELMWYTLYMPKNILKGITPGTRINYDEFMSEKEGTEPCDMCLLSGMYVSRI